MNTSLPRITLRFTNTRSNAGTGLDVTLNILAISPSMERSVEEIVYVNGSMDQTGLSRMNYSIEFIPFKTIHDPNWPHNHSELQLLINSIAAYRYVIPVSVIGLERWDPAIDTANRFALSRNVFINNVMTIQSLETSLEKETANHTCSISMKSINKL